MAQYLIEGDTLTRIASAVRTKGGTSSKYTVPNGLVSAIMNIETNKTVVEEVAGNLNSAVITKTSTNLITVGNYVDDDNFILIFSVRVGSGSWTKKAFCPAVSKTKFLDIDYNYASSSGYSTVEGALGGGDSMVDNWSAVYSSGSTLAVGSNCSFGTSAVLLYIGE